jgi:phosphate transport system substrate-binding protein
VNTPQRRILAGAIALTLVAAACGSDDDSSSSTEAPAGTDGGTETTDGGGATSDLSGTLVGAGASSQAAAMAGWQAGFQAANPDTTVEYDPIGSGGGRETFLEGGSDFAGSDAALKDDEYQQSIERCAGDQGAVNLPHYISPIALPYNLPSLEGETLNLSPEVIAGIFANEITVWNDPTIAADNPDLELPDTTINPVHRSDESGTTENFTDYVAAVEPDIWTVGAIEVWPEEYGGEGAQGTSGVVAAIAAGEGSIGYADASQVIGLGVASIQVGEEFVPYSAEAAARIVDVSPRLEGRAEQDFAIELQRDTTESGVYPIALVSYHIVCLDYADDDVAALVKDFMLYVSSPEGQEAAQAAAGSAPISDALRSQVQAVIEAIE